MFEQQISQIEKPEGFYFIFRPLVSRTGRVAMIAGYRPVGFNNDLAVIVSEQEVRRLNLPMNDYRRSPKKTPAIWLRVDKVVPMKTSKGFIAVQVEEAWPFTFRVRLQDDREFILLDKGVIVERVNHHGMITEVIRPELPQVGIKTFMGFADRGHYDVLAHSENFSYLGEEKDYPPMSMGEGPSLLNTAETYVAGWEPTLHGLKTPAYIPEAGDLNDPTFFPTSMKYKMGGMWVETPFGVCTMEKYFEIWRTFSQLCLQAKMVYAGEQ